MTKQYTKAALSQKRSLETHKLEPLTFLFPAQLGEERGEKGNEEEPKTGWRASRPHIQEKKRGSPDQQASDGHSRQNHQTHTNISMSSSAVVAII